MKYCGLNTCDMANGEGIRVSLFVSGCRFHCPDCFNEKEQDFSFGEEYTEKTKQRIVNLLENPNIDGLSLLGGDPLWQDSAGLIELINLCEEAHRLGKNVWIWSGFTWEEVMNGEDLEQISMTDFLSMRLISLCNVWVDGLFKKDKKDLSLAWRGSSNQRVIDVQKSLKEGEVILYEAKSNA